MKVAYAVAYPGNYRCIYPDDRMTHEIEKFNYTYSGNQETTESIARKIKRELGFLPHHAVLVFTGSDNSLHFVTHEFKNSSSVFREGLLQEEVKKKLAQRFEAEYTAKDELAFLVTVQGWCTKEDRKKLKNLGLQPEDVGERVDILQTYLLGQGREEKEKIKFNDYDREIV